MSIFIQLGSLYSDIDNQLAILEYDARTKRHTRKEREIQTKRRENDQAYFLYMFTRLEDRIRELTDILTTNKSNTLTNWHYKRVWEILNRRATEDRLHFLDRVALLTPIGQRDYNLIQNYYRQRNSIAHGQSFTITIDIMTVIDDLKRLYNDLKAI